MVQQQQVGWGGGSRWRSLSRSPALLSSSSSSSQWVGEEGGGHQLPWQRTTPAPAALSSLSYSPLIPVNSRMEVVGSTTTPPLPSPLHHHLIFFSLPICLCCCEGRLLERCHSCVSPLLRCSQAHPTPPPHRPVPSPPAGVCVCVSHGVVSIGRCLRGKCHGNGGGGGDVEAER